MTERGPVVCGTDLGVSGGHAAELAARLAAATGRALRLIHVTGAGPEPVAEAELDAATRVLRERMRARLEAAAAGLEKERVRAEGLGPHAEAELLEGRPWEQLVEHATRVEASLLVIGPHGAGGPVHSVRGGLSEWVLGSTADRVVRHAPCPVVVGPRADAPIGPIAHGPWVAAIDFSEASRAALLVADGLARAVGANLIALHVDAGFGEQHDGPMRFAEEAHAKQEELAALAREVVGHDIEVRLAFGEPASSVVLAAEQLGASLIAIGTHSRTGLAHFLLGSTAERTLRRATVPVLVVRG